MITLDFRPNGKTGAIAEWGNDLIIIFARTGGFDWFVKDINDSKVFAPAPHKFIDNLDLCADTLEGTMDDICDMYSRSGKQFDWKYNESE